MAIVEFIYPKSPGSDIVSGTDFRMEVKEGPYEEDLPVELFHKRLIDIRSTLPGRTASLVGAMNALMNNQTHRMREEAKELVLTVDEALTSCGYRSFHCFGLQGFGRYRVTNQQATIVDGMLAQRSDLYIALDTTPDSPNAKAEILYRLKLRRSVVALFNKDNPRPEYRKWLAEQVESGPDTNPSAIFLTYKGLYDLGQGIRKIADFRYFLSTRQNRIAQ